MQSRIFLILYLGVALLMSAQKVKADVELRHSALLLLADPGNSRVAESLTKSLKGNLRGRLQTNPRESTELALVARALAVHQIATTFEQCAKTERMRRLTAGILDSATILQTGGDPCRVLEGSPIEPVLKAADDVSFAAEMQLEKNIRRLNAKELARSAIYWSSRIRNGVDPISLEQLCQSAKCSPDLERDLKEEFLREPAAATDRLLLGKMRDRLNDFVVAGGERPEEIDELLLWTKALKSRTKQIRADYESGKSPKRIQHLTGGEVYAAQKEVVDAVRTQFMSVVEDDPQAKSEDRQSVNRNVVRRGLDRLVKTSPVTVAKILVSDPAQAIWICRSLERIEVQDEKDEHWQQVYFWGGVSALALSGVGTASALGIAALAASTSATATTLVGAATAVASSAAIVGAGLGALEGVSAAVSASEDFELIRNLKANFFSGAGGVSNFESISSAEERAYSNMIAATAGIGSIIPLGAAWKSMQKMAKSASKATRAGPSTSVEIMNGVEEVGRDIASDPRMKTLFESIASEVGPESSGEFVGLISTYSQSARRELMEALLAAPPEKRLRAIREGLERAREACR